MTHENDQKELQQGKGLSQYEPETLKYLTKPIGKAIFKNAVEKRGRPKKDTKAHWSDRIKCEICGKEFTRSARTKHTKTEFHQAHLKFDQKIKKLLLKE